MFPADVTGREGLAFSFIKKARVIDFIVLDRKKKHVLQCSESSQSDFIICILKNNKWLTEKNKKQRIKRPRAAFNRYPQKAFVSIPPKGATERKV